MDGTTNHTTESSKEARESAPISRLAEAFAQRLTARISNEYAYKILHENGYLRINSNDIEYKPPRDIEGSRHLYRIHLSVEYGEIIEKLMEQKIIPIYNPTTLLPTNYNQTKPEPVAYLDEVGKLIIEFKKNENKETSQTGRPEARKSDERQLILKTLLELGYNPDALPKTNGKIKGPKFLAYNKLEKQFTSSCSLDERWKEMKRNKILKDEQ